MCISIHFIYKDISTLGTHFLVKEVSTQSGFDKT